MIGHIARNSEDLAGRVFGELTVISRSYKDKWRVWWWLCKCSCGNETIKCNKALRKGDVVSCGCISVKLRIKNKTKHGHAVSGEVTGLYKSWMDAKQRCINPNITRYSAYGGKGIKVCERWQSFDNFLEDMGDSWKPGLTLDRINNDGNYEPGNCQWISREENSRKQFLDKEKMCGDTGK